MEEVKIIFKRMIMTTIILFLYGIIFQIKYIYFGCVSGCLVALLNFYLLSQNVKAVAYTKDVKYAKKIAILGYLKRYFIYMIYLALIIYCLGFNFFIAGIIGLLMLKFNIYILIISEKIKKFHNKQKNN